MNTAIYTLSRWARMYYPYKLNACAVHNWIAYLHHFTTMMSGLDYVKSQIFSYSFCYTRIALDWIRDVRKSSPVCSHVCFMTTTMMMAENQKKSNNKNVSFFTSSSLVDSSSSRLNLQFFSSCSFSRKKRTAQHLRNFFWQFRRLASYRYINNISVSAKCNDCGHLQVSIPTTIIIIINFS